MRNPPRRTSSRTALLLLAGFMFVNVADKSVLGLTADPIMEEFDLTATGFGALASAFYLLFSVSALLVGMLGDRFPARTLLAALGLVWAAAQLPVVIPAAGYAVLLGTRVVLGAGEGPGFPLANHTAFSWYPEGRRALPAAAITVGGALGAVVGGPLVIAVDGLFGWRAAFGALGVMGLGWVLVWLRYGGTGPYAPSPAAAKPVEASGGLVPRRRVLLTGTWLGGTFTTFTAMWALAVGLAWMPLFLEEDTGLTDAQIGATVGLPSVLTVVLGPLLGIAAQRLLGRGASTRIAYGAVGGAVGLAAGLCMFGMTRAGGVPLLLLLMAVAFCGNAQVPLVNAAIADGCPARLRGAALGLSYAVAALASVLGPFTTGRIIDAAASRPDGFRHAFDVAAGLLAAGAVVSVLTIRPGRDAARTRRAGAASLPRLEARPEGRP
ncbi:MFS transporter [Actinomadura sp. NEAU-AAG7]|uniref:MFS transporter n=1 Tax=Actinomadura sp. NEAU-AAG7 TaxID=2839640 RepID=UPI001BE42142|nr:MFS transporter [Actinomadura sp. NEAU-AAG7]MBT2210855.1 MFS transporter [Actinomadura sp. NEAU-AAG7]